MTDFFKNKNVVSAVIERVPCSFAKANKDGSAGTHYTMVLLGRDNAVLYVGSECEHLHGEGIQAVHELGGGTCYGVTETFRKTLSKIKVQHSVSRSILPVAEPLPFVLERVREAVWRQAATKHNERIEARGIDDLTDVKVRALQYGVNLVASSMLGIEPRQVRGAHSKRVTNHTLDYSKPAQIFDVDYRTFSADDDNFPTYLAEKEQWRNIVLSPARSEHNKHVSMPAFAIRDREGVWTVLDDKVKAWAENRHTVYKEEYGKPSYPCMFCNESFERMYRHTQGAKHINRVLEVVKLTCKATSKTGLRMLNNPRHRGMFLKPR